MANSIPSDWRMCATCSHWCGRTSTDPWCRWVDFDNNERALCSSGGFNDLSMPAMSCRSNWTQRFK